MPFGQFRPIGFSESLRERLRHIKMRIGESVDSYFGRMQDLLNRWTNHNMFEDFLISLFVGGL